MLTNLSLITYEYEINLEKKKKKKESFCVYINKREEIKIKSQSN